MDLNRVIPFHRKQRSGVFVRQRSTHISRRSGKRVSHREYLPYVRHGLLREGRNPTGHSSTIEHKRCLLKHRDPVEVSYDPIVDVTGGNHAHGQSNTTPRQLFSHSEVAGPIKTEPGMPTALTDFRLRPVDWDKLPQRDWSMGNERVESEEESCMSSVQVEWSQKTLVKKAIVEYKRGEADTSNSSLQAEAEE